MDSPPTTLTREDALRIQLLSGVSLNTIRNWQRGKARPASAKRIEAALAALAREAAPATPPSSG